MTEQGGWYETHAAEAAACYESVAAEQINAWLLDLLPKRRAIVLDVGAGSGRDTAWLARRLDTRSSPSIGRPQCGLRPESVIPMPGCNTLWIASLI